MVASFRLNLDQRERLVDDLIFFRTALEGYLRKFEKRPDLHALSDRLAAALSSVKVGTSKVAAALRIDTGRHVTSGSAGLTRVNTGSAVLTPGGNFAAWLKQAAALFKQRGTVLSGNGFDEAGRIYSQLASVIDQAAK